MTHALGNATGNATGNEILVISGADVRRMLTMERCIELIDATMRTVSRGGAQLPLRIGAGIPGGNVVAVMPGHMNARADAPAVAGAKVIAVFPNNSQRGLPSHSGVVVLFDVECGAPLAMVDATAITDLRTAAASAVATNALARADSTRLAIIGTGEQAAAHVYAMAVVRPLRSIKVWGRSQERAQEFAQRESAAAGVSIEVAATVQQAVADADIVCTTTSAREPILQGAWLRAGAHVNLVGASSAQAREADDDLVKRAAFFVDFRASALAQAGELLGAFGTRASEHIRAEIGEVLSGARPGRTNRDQVTVYKSLGIAAQDLAAAHYVYEYARRTGGGVRAVL
jgi:ornithine cyclodeaminase/alanine dehydrogenase-like protein (mu-crystallin family)